jgi:HPt (histidine-containing phosphotransfer) domain-containing protein
MDDYVSKPIRIEELVEALSKSHPLLAGQEPEQSADLAPEPEWPGAAFASGNAQTEEAKPTPPGSPGPAFETAVLDPAALGNLLSMLGGEFEYLVELIDSFLEDGPQLMAELEQAIAGGNAADVRRVAHSLKSNGADFGATTFSTLCKELEMMGKSGALDGAAGLAAQAEDEFGKVEVALASVRREGRLPQA